MRIRFRVGEVGVEACEAAKGEEGGGAAVEGGWLWFNRCSRCGGEDGERQEQKLGWKLHVGYVA
jgi:hypothetical protein